MQGATWADHCANCHPYSSAGCYIRRQHLKVTYFFLLQSYEAKNTFAELSGFLSRKGFPRLVKCLLKIIVNRRGGGAHYRAIQAVSPPFPPLPKKNKNTSLTNDPPLEYLQKNFRSFIVLTFFFLIFFFFYSIILSVFYYFILPFAHSRDPLPFLFFFFLSFLGKREGVAQKTIPHSSRSKRRTFILSFFFFHSFFHSFL